MHELRRRFQDTRTPNGPALARRTVAEIRAAVPAQRARRIAREEQQEADEREQREAQNRRLAGLQHDPEAAWQRVGDLLVRRGTRHYPEVVRLLGDLAALADREGATAAFGERYAGVIAAHRTKRALMRDLRAGNLEQ